MGDTANGSWTSRDLDAHLAQQRRFEQRQRDWELAAIACEFGIRLAEKGHNLEYILEKLKECFCEPSKSTAEGSPKNE